MSKARRAPIDLEKTLTDLEAIVAELETGDLPLEKSLESFERGVRLSRDCQGALQQAEQRVQALMGDALQELDPGTLAPRDEPDEDAD